MKKKLQIRISLVYNKILDTAFLQTYEVVDSLTFLKG